jgi:hypothetical protein
VVVTGPGLDEPIELTGTLTVFEGKPTGAAEELSTFLAGAAILSGPDAGWYVLEPNLETLGPRYEVRSTLGAGGGGSEYVQYLYPFAPDRPLFHIPPDSAKELVGRSMGLWWSGPPSVVAILRARGLPLAPPPVQEPPAVPAPEAPLSVTAIDSSRVWATVGLGTALTLLLLGGALVGRRTRVAGSA